MKRGHGGKSLPITSAPPSPTRGPLRKFSVSRRQLEQQNAYLEEEVVEARAFGDLVGQSAALRHIVTQIDMVAPTNASVLILGETGTARIGRAGNPPPQPAQNEAAYPRQLCSVPKELYEKRILWPRARSFYGSHQRPRRDVSRRLKRDDFPR